MREIKSTTQLINKLKNILFKQRFVLFTAGLFGTLSVVLATAVILATMANLMVLPVWFKITLMFLAGLVTLFFLGRFAINRLFKGDVETVAVKLEEKNKSLKGRLIAAVQFARSGEHRGYSRDLVEATKLQALREAGAVNFNEIVSFYPIFRSSRALAVSVVVAVALLILLPGFFSYSYEVFSNPTVEIAPPLAYEIVPTPTSSEWVRYKDIDIGASIFGQRLPEEAYIYHRLAGIHSADDADSLSEELSDRFGRPPREIDNLLYTVKIKALAALGGIESIITEHGQVIIRPFPGMQFNKQRLEPLLRDGVKISLNQIRLNYKQLGNEWPTVLGDVLKRIVDYVKRMLPYSQGYLRISASAVY